MPVKMPVGDLWGAKLAAERFFDAIDAADRPDDPAFPEFSYLVNAPDDVLTAAKYAREKFVEEQGRVEKLSDDLDAALSQLCRRRLTLLAVNRKVLQVLDVTVEPLRTDSLAEAAGKGLLARRAMDLDGKVV